MIFTDYFIKDKHLLSEDEYYQKRLSVFIILVLGLLSAIFSVLSLFGVFQSESNLLSVLLCIVSLLTYKKTGNDYIPLALIIIAGSVVLCINISSTGYIYSYNNKWFVLMMIILLFVKRKFVLPYLFFIIGLQIYFFYQTPDFVQNGINPDLKVDEFMDNISFFILSFLILKLLYNYTNSKTVRLNNSRDLIEKRTLQLLQSNEELERFAYIASHDLKTPLRNIISFSSLLEREMSGQENVKAQEYLNHIKGSSRKLNSLVTDVLTYPKVSGINNVNEEVNDTKEIILSIQEMISDFLQSKNGEIIITNSLPQIKAQGNLLLMLFKNLIENGLKYNESKKPVVFISSFECDQTHYVVFKDNGIGIAKKFHNSIFDMFSRLHAESKYEGTGLGLSLCKKIMDQLDGEIFLYSEVGKGSKFVLKFNSNSVVDIPKKEELQMVSVV